MQVIIFQKELYAYHWTTRKKKKYICNSSSHSATRKLYAKVSSHKAPVGALCEGSMRIGLRSELYAKGALCGPTHPHLNKTAYFLYSYTQRAKFVTCPIVRDIFTPTNHSHAKPLSMPILVNYFL